MSEESVKCYVNLAGKTPSQLISLFFFTLRWANEVEGNGREMEGHV